MEKPTRYDWKDSNLELCKFFALSVDKVLNWLALDWIASHPNSIVSRRSSVSPILDDQKNFVLTFLFVSFRFFLFRFVSFRFVSFFRFVSSSSKIRCMASTTVGSKMDYEAKLAAAELEEAWEGIGKQAGTYVWRVENFQIKPWPNDRYGA